MAMPDDNSIARYRRWYRRLLGLYSPPYRERFGECMEQTFTDLCRERAAAEKGLSGYVLWLFLETLIGAIRDNARFMMTRSMSKRLSIWAGVAVMILMIPVVAMQVSDSWNWGVFDFVFAFLLMFGVGCAYEFIASRGGTTAYRTGVGIACLTTFLLLWINAAVGIIGDEPVNVLYFAVPAVLVAGAFCARFEPQGMSLVLFATAVVQMLVPTVALAFSPGVPLIFALNAVFAGMWVVSGMFFRYAQLKHQ